jgi:hypothetical protein
MKMKTINVKLNALICNTPHLGYLLFLLMQLLLLRLGSSPAAWYDKGLNTHTASVFQAQGVYGTSTIKGSNSIDSAIITGSTVLLPVAWFLSLFGQGMFQTRVVSALYTILAVLLLYNICERAYGSRATLFGTLTFLLIPPVGETGFILLGRHVLGETALFAFVLLGFDLPAQRMGRAGNSLGCHV